MRWIRWTQWGKDGMIGVGQMPMNEVNENLVRFSKKAHEVLEKTGADHVVYGLKLYDSSGELESVKFYMVPMDDEQFQKDVATLKGVTVYAVHAIR